MATFAQWAQHALEGEVKRVVWVCGSETVLVEEVVDHYRAILGASEFGYVSLLGGHTPDREVWAEANQYPFDPKANRLVLVRDADKIKRWKPLDDWLANSRQLPTVYLLFVSSETEFPYIFKDGKSTGELKSHVEAIKLRGRVVRCSPPAEEDQLKWVQRHAPMPDTVARYLLTRVGGDLGKARNVCRKLSLFPGDASQQVVDVLCAESPGDDFVDAVLAQDRSRALTALDGMSDREFSPAIGLLDSRLEVMGKLNHALRERKTLKDIAVSGTVPLFLARLLLPQAKYYDHQKRVHCRRVLAASDEALRSGARVGVLESIVSLW